jgi:uncharacterized membrane-anchored protein YitT (DUF2179 family)
MPARWSNLEQALGSLGLLTAGSFLVGAAANGLLIPHGFVGDGFLGLSILVHYIWPALPVGVLYLVFNLPLYVLGWRLVGRRFFLYSVAGALILALAAEYVKVTIPVEDKILSAVLAGIMSGVGGGLILRSQGSSGGTDILSVILLIRSSVRVGTTILVFNCLVLALLALTSSLQAALYTLIYLYVTARMVDLVLSGLSQRKAVLIISLRWHEIADGILREIGRGATLLRGEGAFTAEERNVVYTVVALNELPRVKALVRRVDPNAFVVVSDTAEVMGQGIGNQPHW